MNSGQPGMFSPCLYSLSQQTNYNNKKNKKARPPSQGKLLALPVRNKPFLYHLQSRFNFNFVCLCECLLVHIYVSCAQKNMTGPLN